MIKGIFFDIYQTLIDVELKHERGSEAWEVFSKFLASKGIDEYNAGRCEINYWQEIDKYYQDKDPKIYHHDWQKSLRSMFQSSYGVEISDTELSELIWKFRRINQHQFKLYPQVKEVLNELSQKYIIASASIAQASYTRIELQELGIEQYFQHLVFSSEIGFKKPSTFFYRKALEIVQLEPEECIMIGNDLYDDIYGAKRMGIHAIFVDNPITPQEQINVQPDAAISIQDFALIPLKIQEIERREELYEHINSKNS